MGLWDLLQAHGEQMMHPFLCLPCVRLGRPLIFGPLSDSHLFLSPPHTTPHPQKQCALSQHVLPP